MPGLGAPKNGRKIEAELGAPYDPTTPERSVATMRRWTLTLLTILMACGGATDPNHSAVEGTWLIRAIAGGSPSAYGVDSARLDIVVAQGYASAHWTDGHFDYDAITALQGALIWKDSHESDNLYTLRGDTMHLTSAHWTGPPERD